MALAICSKCQIYAGLVAGVFARASTRLPCVWVRIFAGAFAFCLKPEYLTRRFCITKRAQAKPVRGLRSYQALRQKELAYQKFDTVPKNATKCSLFRHTALRRSLLVTKIQCQCCCWLPTTAAVSKTVSELFLTKKSQNTARSL